MMGVLKKIVKVKTLVKSTNFQISMKSRTPKLLCKRDKPF